VTVCCGTSTSGRLKKRDFTPLIYLGYIGGVMLHPLHKPNKKPHPPSHHPINLKNGELGCDAGSERLSVRRAFFPAFSAPHTLSHLDILSPPTLVGMVFARTRTIQRTPLLTRIMLPPVIPTSLARAFTHVALSHVRRNVHWTADTK
jgi:hypothetical protein